MRLVTAHTFCILALRAAGKALLLTSADPRRSARLFVPLTAAIDPRLLRVALVLFRIGCAEALLLVRAPERDPACLPDARTSLAAGADESTSLSSLLRVACRSAGSTAYMHIAYGAMLADRSAAEG